MQSLPLMNLAFEFQAGIMLDNLNFNCIDCNMIDILCAQCSTPRKQGVQSL